MGGGHLHADARFALRHHRVAEADHVDAALQQRIGHCGAGLGVVQHDGHNRMIARLDVEPALGHCLAEVPRVLPQLLAPLCAVGEHVEHRQARVCNHGRHRVREEVRTRFLAQQVHNRLLRSRKPAGCATERLAQRGCDNIYVMQRALRLRGPTSAIAHKPGGMALIYHNKRIVRIRQRTDFVELRDIAIHRKDPVSGNQADVRVLRILQLRLQVVHVAVLVDVAVGLAQADAVDNRGVVQPVADNRIVRTQKRLEKARICIEARVVEDGILLLVEVGQRILQLLMHRLRTADKPHARHAKAIRINALLRRLHDGGVVGQPQIIVGAEVNHIARSH